MKTSESDLSRLIDSELSRVIDPERRRELVELLVSPFTISLCWDYGANDERLDCWQVGQSANGKILLTYCEQGFGPSFPWGFVFPEEDSLGMDSQWHSGLEDAAINAGLISAPPGYQVPGPRELYRLRQIELFRSTE